MAPEDRKAVLMDIAAMVSAMRESALKHSSNWEWAEGKVAGFDLVLEVLVMEMDRK